MAANPSGVEKAGLEGLSCSSSTACTAVGWNDPRRTRRRTYRIADNFLAFWLGLLDRFRPEIERGLGESILDVLLASLDDHMGRPWEEAFRDHLRRRAAAGDLG